MVRLINFLFLLFLSAFLTGCEKEFFLHNSPLSAKVDGVLYSAEEYKTTGQYGSSPVYLSKTNEGFNFLMIRPLQSMNNFISIGIVISENTPFKTGNKYLLKDNCAFISFYRNGMKHHYDNIDGNIIFSDFHPGSSSNYLLSGTFEFTAVDPITNVIIHVTDGYFQNLCIN